MLTTPTIADDHQYHLFGGTNMLNSRPSFHGSGSLREATAWLYLRQDIYISLVTQQPPRTNLEEFSSSYDITEDNDFGWAKRIVLLVGDALSYAFGNESSIATGERWNKIEHAVESWQANKPKSFEPIHLSSQLSDGMQRLPNIWMLSGIHGTFSSHHGTT